MNMRILSSLLVAFAITLFLPHSSFAQQSLECDPILGISFPDDESWENAYILQGSDGSAWQ